MNKERRKAISDLIDTAESLQTRMDGLTYPDPDAEVADAIVDDLSALADDIESIRDEEQEYYDNMPESSRDGDKGQIAEAAVSALDQALDCVNDAVSWMQEEHETGDTCGDLGDAISSLDEATA